MEIEARNRLLRAVDNRYFLSWARNISVVFGRLLILNDNHSYRKRPSRMDGGHLVIIWSIQNDIPLGICGRINISLARIISVFDRRSRLFSRPELN